MAMAGIPNKSVNAKRATTVPKAWSGYWKRTSQRPAGVMSLPLPEGVTNHGMINKVSETKDQRRLLVVNGLGFICRKITYLTKNAMAIRTGKKTYPVGVQPD